MNRAKAIFVSFYLAACAAAASLAAYQILRFGSWAWVGVLASTLPILYLSAGNILFHHSATTTRWLPVPSGLLVLGSLAVLLPGLPGSRTPSLVLVQLGLAIGYAAYLLWYSRFAPRDRTRIRRGQPLPNFDAVDLEGRRVSSRELAGTPALLVFYRGNWCPICVTQVQDLARNYRALRDRGVRVILVSPQSPEHTASLARKFDAPMEFWIDENLSAARTLGILDAQGLPLGMEVLGYERDTVLPTSILIDGRGVVFHDDQTDSYRIRPEPEEYLAAFDAHASQTDSVAA